MSNIIDFGPKRRVEEKSPVASGYAGLSMPAKVAALQADARSTLSLLADQFEVAMQHAREIEPRLRNSRTRQQFGDQIELIERLLDVIRIKILQL